MYRYRVYWNGKLQPTNGISYESAKQYIKSSLSAGNCFLWQFEIFDNYGQLKTNIITDEKADPTLLTSYFKLN